jgi:hypothetical protein
MNAKREAEAGSGSGKRKREAGSGSGSGVELYCFIVGKRKELKSKSRVKRRPASRGVSLDLF